MTPKEILDAYKIGSLSLTDVQEILRKLKQESPKKSLSEGQMNELETLEIADRIVNKSSQIVLSRDIHKPEEAYELMTFKEVWEEQALPGSIREDIKTIVCFLSDSVRQLDIIDAMRTINRKTKIIFISGGTTYQKESEERYSISKTERNTYEKAFKSIREDYGRIDAILYLWPFEDIRYVPDYFIIMNVLQAIALTKLRPKRILLGAQYENELDRCYLDSWIGFERSLKQMLTDTEFAGIFQEAEGKKQNITIKERLQRVCVEIHNNYKFQSVLYKEGKRYVCKVKEISIEAGESLLRTGRTYLITGGCGGLGLLFAKHLAKKYSANLILTGRAPIDGKKEKNIKLIEELGSRVLYLQADVCDRAAMEEGLNKVKKQFGNIYGVIHAAGIASKQTIFEKDIRSFEEVVNPKIRGTLILDEMLQEEPLDFICYFSSSSAIIGDFGSCDYSIGNRFLMAYAQYREEKRNKGEIKGKTKVINWPVWREGGMSLGNEENTNMYLKSSGQRYLESEEGIDIFESILIQKKIQYLVLSGKRSRVENFLGLRKEEVVDTSVHITSFSNMSRGRRVEMKGLSLEECIEWDIKEIINKLLRIPRDKLNVDIILSSFGFNSIYLLQFAKMLTSHYEIEITPVIFFGYSTIKKLRQYFIKQHKESIEKFYREDAVEKTIKQRVHRTSIRRDISQKKGHRRSRFTLRNSYENMPKPIAIIGMSGRFPEARNIKEMWEILSGGKDVVKEIPAERFDWREYYGDPNKEAGKTNCIWCGCIPGASEFDPLFFEISPKEAETMDPRQRLLLQEAWKALEDAGYGEWHIRKSKIGMFVGVEQGEYLFFVKDQGSITSNNNAILASRLAYFLDLHGPVMAIDTACSSGLVAAHQACMSIRNNECDTAMAAGVNLLLTPDAFIANSQAGMLSSDGKCYAFDKRANGIIPGEAVAVVVLKRLSQAMEDGDHIYAVIEGSGINYDGKTNGITAPSGISQANLLKSIYNEYKINPEEIEYIVTHGTGTELGDPIEINALYDAFKGYTKKQNYCALTSTKPNFGHTFAPSGIVSLISLVQAMRHETIPASLNYEEENNFINWKESPFYVNKSKKSWPKSEGKKQIGAVSAFGMSGTNVHMVVRDFFYDEAVKSVDDFPYYVFVFSAKTQEVLEQRIKDIIAMLQGNDAKVHSLSEISYTLQIGRQHFNNRLAVVIQDREDAVYVLKQVGGKEKLSNLFQGKVIRTFTGQKAIRKYIQELLTQSRSLYKDRNKYQEILYALAEFYCQGYDIPWDELYGENRPRRVSLPTYPFARERYWVSEVENRVIGINGAISGNGTVIHPLLHRNTSDLTEQRFSSVFTGGEFFLSDHIIQGKRVLSGVAYLEMARRAIKESGGIREGSTIILKKVVWTSPIVVVDHPAKVHIGLYSEDNGDISYEIYSESENKEEEVVVHSQGRAVLRVANEAAKLDIRSLQLECSEKIIPGSECYEVFKTIGIEYGPAYQGIESIYVGGDKILAKLVIPSSVLDTEGQYVLHPSIIDSALQSSIGLAMGNGYTSSKIISKPSLPFALEMLEVISSCMSNMWALLTHSEGSKIGDKVEKLDIDICDEEGKICVRIKGFTLRILESEVNRPEIGILMLEPYWKDQSIIEEAAKPDYTRHIVMLCEPNKEITMESIESCIEGVSCHILQSEEREIDKRYQNYAMQLFEKIECILNDKSKGSVLIQIVISRENEKEVFSGLLGLLKSAHLENPRIMGQVIELEKSESVEGIVTKLKENSRKSIVDYIRYEESKRYILSWEEVEISRQEELTIPWKDKGTYLIIGGAGGLGQIFAREILHKVHETKLILVGHSKLNYEKEVKIRELEALGTQIDYRQADITDNESVKKLIKSIEKDYKEINGIIHSAGLIRDNFIIKKSKNEFLEVLRPKVSGLVNIDETTKHMKIDFFILFSSLSGVFGNIGQADYATANAFMDAYAKYRNNLVKVNQRHGKTLSINWSHWADGGMQLSEETEKTIMIEIGLVPMKKDTGINALYKSLICGKDQVMVMGGDVNKFKIIFKQQSLNHLIEIPLNKDERKPIPAITQDVLQKKTSNYFKELLSFFIKLSTNRIDTEVPMGKYGMNSLLGTQLIYKLEQTFGPLSKTLFFEYQTINALTEYFLESHREQLIVLLELNKEAGNIKNSIETKPVQYNLNIRRCSRISHVNKEEKYKKGKGPLDIAIIGLSGRYPQARNTYEFWKNLKDGRDCITEIPEERWTLEGFFHPDREKAVSQGKSYCKWGGFLDGFADFDPLFFHISPREAINMDPQERLFIESCWEVFEDAGYTKEQIATKYNGRIGVFVGITDATFNLYAPEFWRQGKNVAPRTSFSSVANRISYFLNLHGPSIPIDTMCSSSLTAVYEACEHLYWEDCEMALAGGVNLYVHPLSYIGLCMQQMLSIDAQCRSFGQGGNGFIPGEGVGVVLLKRLSQAIADKDRIYAVIRGAGINQNGETNGYTVPNPNAQIQLIEDNFIKSGIDPRTISYIEAAANGSELGDPIEINALSKVFRKYTSDEKFCAIGSVKSNIGHAQAASGISQLTKVILQLQHKKLVPSIKANPLNPNINFKNTPFYLQHELQEWKRPVVRLNGQEQEFPRRATISSFGAGGSNAHLIVEEYITPQKETIHIASTIKPQIIVFSARNRDRLQAIVQQMLEFIERQNKISLSDIAYTLQLGREEMEYRLAMVVNSCEDFIKGMKEYLKSVQVNKEIETNIPIFTGDVEDDHSDITSLFPGKSGEVVLEILMAETNLEKIAVHWTKGAKIPWESLHIGEEARKISLPTYPFVRTRYWISTQSEEFVKQVQKEDQKIEVTPDKSIQEILQEYIMGFFSEQLNIALNQIKLNKNILEYGVDSIIVMKLIRKIERRFQTKITGREMLEHRTIKSLSAHFAQKIEIQNYQGNKDDANILFETEHLKISEYKDKQVIEAMDEYMQGELKLEEIQKLIEEGEIV